MWRLTYVRDAVVMVVDHIAVRVHEVTQAWLDRGYREVERYLRENAKREDLP